MSRVTAVRLGDGDDDENTVEGTLITAGETTTGQSGITKYWPKSTLQSSLGSLEGTLITHTHDETVRNTVGRVTKAWMSGDKLRFRGAIYDNELLSRVRNGLSSVSLGGNHEEVDEMEENDDGAKIVAGPLRFRHVALVTSPAAKSATIDIANVPGVGDSDESTPDGEAIAAALSDGRHAFALETGSIDSTNDDDEDDTTDMQITIDEAAVRQIEEIRSARDDFDDTTTDGEIVAWLCTQVDETSPTDEEIETEQSRLKRDVLDFDSSDSVELDKSELSDVEKEQLRLRREVMDIDG